MPQRPNILLAQLNPIVGNMPYNLDKVRKVWAEAPEETDLIVFSEMIICAYPCDDLVMKPFFMDQVESAVHNLVQDSEDYKPAILLSTPWRENGKTYNAVHLVQGGEIKATTYKHHLPNYGVFDEERIFESGPLPSPIDFMGTKLGVLICEDLWYTDVAGHLKDQGAQILIAPNGSPFTATMQDERDEVVRQRIQETGLPFIYVNQIGGQDELVFDGNSFIMNEKGEITTRLPSFEEAVSSGEKIEQTKSTEEQIYKALVLGLRDYIGKNGFPGVVIGMSGGIDSALTAVIAVDALGADKVNCVMMPSRFTSQDSLDDARECTELIGANYDTVPIDETMNTFNTIIPGLEGTSHENVQPRIRGLILMAHSNKTGSMVLSTGNKSEMAVGYATLYGDMCGGFNALKDLYKTQVYQLSNWRNKHKPEDSLGPEGRVIPERIITKAPTAELKANQTDQDTLPEYEELDDILACLIEKDMSMDEIIAHGHKAETISRVWKMLDRAEYKRRQAPPGVKITSRAFGRDRRYPITNHFVNLIEK